MQDQQLKRSYLLIRYFECTGVIIQLLELATNKCAGAETSRIKYLSKIPISSESGDVSKVIKRLRHKLVHSSLDFDAINELIIEGDVTPDKFMCYMCDIAEYIHCTISISSLYEYCEFILSYVKSHEIN